MGLFVLASSWSLGGTVSHSQSGQINVDNARLSSVKDRIAAEEYALSTLKEEGGWTAPNRDQNLRTVWRKGRIDITPRQKDNELWQFTFELTSVGRAGMDEMPPIGPILAETVKAGRIEWDHGNVTEWYVNGPQGIKQGFYIETRPPGSEDQPLIIAGRIQGLTASTVSRGQAVVFHNAHGGQALRMQELEVYDCTGRKTPSRFRTESGSLQLIIDDRKAPYPMFVDPTWIDASWSAESDQAGAEFGWSVASAGDINNDGYSDVIIGAPYYDNGHTDEGRVYLFLGSNIGLMMVPACVMDGGQENAWFGYSLDAAGDVNGDDYDDIIVGAFGYDNGETNEGRAFVFIGSANNLVPSPQWTAESNQAGAEFGASVATAGDVNGDGYSDVIVGAMLYDAVGFPNTNMGRAYVFHGSPTGLSSTPNWIGQGDWPFAFFGGSVGSAGDVNGDNYDDVIVGTWAYMRSDIEKIEGRAYVFHGSASGLSLTQDWTAVSLQEEQQFGYSVGSAGDVNNDGFDDVVIGAPLFDNGEEEEGCAYLYHGSANGLSSTPAWIAESGVDYAQFGVSVSGAGRVNADNFSDIIVGAWGYNDKQGAAFVYQGSLITLSASPVFSMTYDQANGGFGVSVAAAGDVNGDGLSDVIVGSWGYDNGEENEGQAYAFHGGN
ncbi:integrin alpha [Acidobacteriota bacterium]